MSSWNPGRKRTIALLLAALTATSTALAGFAMSDAFAAPEFDPLADVGTGPGPQTPEEAVAMIVDAAAPTMSRARELVALAAAAGDPAEAEAAAAGLASGWEADATGFQGGVPALDSEDCLLCDLEVKGAALFDTHRDDVSELEDALEADADFPTSVDATLAWQARVLGAGGLELPPVDLPRYASPSEAAFALLEALRVAPTEEDARQVLALDEVEEPVRGPLTDLLAAEVELVRAADAAAAQLAAGAPDWSDRLRPLDRLPTDPATLAPLDATAFAKEHAAATGTVLIARRVVALHAATLADAVGDEPPTHLPDVDVGGSDAEGTGALLGRGCRAFRIDWGGADTYTKDYLFLLELGGSDTYRNNAGGNTCATGCGPLTIATLIDLNGADEYGDPANPKSCGVNGGALGAGAFGMGILMDFGRDDDRYHAGSLGTNGGGAGLTTVNFGFGLGLLVDDGGNDRYTAKSAGTNGGGAGLYGLGIGFKLDFGTGSDTVTADSVGTNGGGSALAGLGFHFDFGGNDAYSAKWVGVNGGAAAVGFGFAYDRDGADRYTAGSVGVNGGGAVGGIAFLVDRAGGDVYSAGGAGANGGAFLASFALLHDKAGNDAYHAGAVATNGGGSLLGFGFLTDKGGNDAYAAASIGANGGGAFYGLGTVTDHAGADAFTAQAIGTNGGAAYISIGTLKSLGAGATRYAATDVATNGGAAWIALGRLRDHGGSDSYAGGSFGTNGGAALLGRGSVDDHGGDDAFTAGSNGVNGGAAFLGWGHVLSRAGNDRYTANACGVNGGACFGGNGTLLDLAGDDAYAGVQKGVNGGAHGTLLPGVLDAKGLLVDHAGNDRYVAAAPGSFGVNGGGSYWGVGFLRDLDGHDQYLATGATAEKPGSGGDCGVNGGACWMGDGTLTDLGTGSDRYVAGSYGTNGGIYNTEHQGSLVDQCGTDSYAAGVSGTNGGAAWSTILLDHMGAGRLVDLGGARDSYLDAAGLGTGVDRTVTGKPNVHGDQLDSGANECGGEPLPLPTRDDVIGPIRPPALPGVDEIPLPIGRSTTALAHEAEAAVLDALRA